jgi:hypothetical protein
MKKGYLLILTIVGTMATGCILLDDSAKVSQYELRRQHFEKYYGNDRDEQLKKGMNREAAFDSISRVRNNPGNSPHAPVPAPANF